MPLTYTYSKVIYCILFLLLFFMLWRKEVLAYFHISHKPALRKVLVMLAAALLILAAYRLAALWLFPLS